MIEHSITEAQLLRYMNTVKDVKEYRRWQIIYLIQIQKMNKTDAAKAAGVARITVYEVLERFNRFGPDGMPSKSTGGRLDSYMSLEEEQALLAQFLESGAQGLIITAKDIKKAAEEALNKSVSIYYAYDLLHRHGWRKITPRAKHPKSKTDIQEEFKKKSHYWSKIV